MAGISRSRGLREGSVADEVALYPGRVSSRVMHVLDLTLPREFTPSSSFLSTIC